MALSLRLAEVTTALIEAHVRANIATALSEVSTDRADNAVSMEEPASYFQFVNVHGFRTPAVLTIVEDFDYRIPQNPNYVGALVTVNVAVIVEDKDSYLLTLKAWRYQAALTKILSNTSLISGDSTVKLVTKVVRNAFSSIYPRDRDEDSPEEMFRKEVVVELEVEHYEQLQH